MTKQHDISGGSGSSGHGPSSSGTSTGGAGGSSGGGGHIRPRTVSSPIPYVSPNSSRPLSPGNIDENYIVK